jgi:hypothetical protein
MSSAYRGAPGIPGKDEERPCSGEYPSRSAHGHVSGTSGVVEIDRRALTSENHSARL